MATACLHHSCYLEHSQHQTLALLRVQVDTCRCCDGAETAADAVPAAVVVAADTVAIGAVFAAPAAAAAAVCKFFVRECKCYINVNVNS